MSVTSELEEDFSKEYQVESCKSLYKSVLGSLSTKTADALYHLTTYSTFTVALLSREKWVQASITHTYPYPDTWWNKQLSTSQCDKFSKDPAISQWSGEFLVLLKNERKHQLRVAFEGASIQTHFLQCKVTFGNRTKAFARKCLIICKLIIHIYYTL